MFNAAMLCEYISYAKDYGFEVSNNSDHLLSYSTVILPRVAVAVYYPHSTLTHVCPGSSQTCKGKLEKVEARP
jgi:hypothetical protein